VETDILDNIMFYLSAAVLWQIAELHTLARDTCMANLPTDKDHRRAGFLRTENGKWTKGHPAQLNAEP